MRKIKELLDLHFARSRNHKKCIQKMTIQYIHTYNKKKENPPTKSSNGDNTEKFLY